MCLTNHQGLFHVSDSFEYIYIVWLCESNKFYEELKFISENICVQAVAVISWDLVSWLLDIAEVIVIAG